METLAEKYHKKKETKKQINAICTWKGSDLQEGSSPVMKKRSMAYSQHGHFFISRLRFLKFFNMASTGGLGD